MKTKSYTKKGPGRVHAYGPGKGVYDPKPDSLDAIKWKLGPTQMRERMDANKRRET